MLDTQIAPEVIVADTAIGPYPRLLPAAVEHAKTLLGISDIDALGEELGFSRQSFWRLRNGKHDVRLSQALKVAEAIDLPLHLTFDIPLNLIIEGGSRG